MATARFTATEAAQSAARRRDPLKTNVDAALKNVYKAIKRNPDARFLRYEARAIESGCSALVDPYRVAELVRSQLATDGYHAMREGYFVYVRWGSTAAVAEKAKSVPKKTPMKPKKKQLS